MALFLLVPGGLPDPVEGEARICSNLDGSCFCLPDRLLHRLHQVLSIVDQHLGSLMKTEFRDEGQKENGKKKHFTSNDLIKTDLLRLLFADVGATQHGGFNRGQDFELSADGWNTLTHLKQDATSADLIPNNEVESFHY